ncbi:hypothetical protein HRG_010560 [Hirsutella rhossiliensis]|uniref:Uncharacterized protein n=1 Tax=Hirsutella rhossiliensis TaxID=111463 RepID=A0A9P8MPR2_9HYPO|nr:uncharacterized protein HRG_10560 [Hirsutella rhossiliensis]KAH0958259.1 hypothetical protein HRG_10560 [Hirsutella rhossiliensis]
MGRLMYAHAITLATGGEIDDRIQGEPGIVYAPEIIRQQLGQVSHYPRSRVPFQKMDDELVHREGLLYSALAQFSFARPDAPPNRLDVFAGLHYKLLGVSDPDFQLMPGERTFTPSIMFVPSATVNQAFDEISNLFYGIFDLWSLYQSSKTTCPNPGRKIKTIDSTPQPQLKLDEWVTQHQSPPQASTPGSCRAPALKFRLDWTRRGQHHLHHGDIPPVHEPEWSTFTKSQANAILENEDLSTEN